MYLEEKESSKIINSIKTLLSFLTKSEKKKMISIGFFSVINSVLETLSAFSIILFAQTITNPDSVKKYFTYIGLQDLSYNRTILFVSVIFGLSYLVKNIFAAIDAVNLQRTTQLINYNLKCRFLGNYAVQDYQNYITRDSILNYNIIEGDIEKSISECLTSLVQMCSEVLVFVFIISMLVFVNPQLIFAIFFIGVVSSFFLVKYLFPLFYKIGKDLQNEQLLAQRSLLNFFHGFKEVILFGKKSYFMDKFKNHTYNRAKITAIKNASLVFPRLVLELLFLFIFISSVLFMTFKADTTAQMIGTLAAYLYAGFRILPGANRVINYLNTFKNSMPHIRRLNNENQLLKNKNPLVENPSFTFNNSIVFNRVSFSFSENPNVILNSINLEIFRGDKVGIIGETGSGKSTLVDLLLGLLSPSSGFIQIDGHAPNCFQWHRMLGYVSQSIFLIDDTIKANILFGVPQSECNLEKLNYAVEQAQLKDLITSLPDGLETKVGERGIRLSGGERQRVAIARALYYDPPVIIFDEATSALDNQTEQNIINIVNDISTDKTLIMIAHRLSTLDRCNKMFLIEKGSLSLKEPRLSNLKDRVDHGVSFHLDSEIPSLR